MSVRATLLRAVKCLVSQVLVAGLLSAIATAPVRAADPALAKVAAELGSRFVAGVNTRETARRAQLARELLTPEALSRDGERKTVELFAKLAERYDSLAFHHAEPVRGGSAAQPRLSLHLYAKSAKDGGWKDLQFYLDPNPPHRIRQLVFVADVAEPVYLPNGEISSRETRAWLNDYIDRLVEQNDLAGGIYIQEGGMTLIDRTFGFADSARTRRIGPSTRFNLGSGGKMFTAVAIARLEETGKLSFADTLASVLPAVAGQAFARKVTLAQLLSHTSGIREFWTDEYEKHWHELRKLSDYLPYVLKAGTSSVPGTRFEYSNSNYILLGLVLEAVTGKSYDDVLHEFIFEPAFMRDTGLYPFDDRDTSQAQRLRRDPKGGWRTAPHGYRGSSAGGALSTTDDMARFASALYRGEIVSLAMVEELTTTKTSSLPDSPMAYGYGFEPVGSGRTRSYGHGGIAAGVNFELRRFPSHGITLIMFSNQDNGAYDDLKRNVTKLITGER